MTRLLTLWTLLLLSGPARAEDPPAPPAPPTAFEQLDKQFGELFVAPLASLLFYDLYFWDNTLPLGEGVGERVKDEEIVGYDAATGYAYARRFEAPAADARVQLAEPREVQIAGINLIITPREEGRLSAELKSGQTVDITGRRTTQLDQLVPPPEGLPESALNREEGVDRVLVRDLAPFGVPVEVRDGVATTLTTRFTLPPTALVPRVGDTVVVGEETAEVVGINGDKLDLRDADRRQSAEPLKNTTQISLPFIVTWLVLGAVFFTLRMGFISIRAFRHAIDVTLGHYDHAGDRGEISHFQALNSALSATVGLGNIAGVAVAVGVGGPGAVFWLIVAGFLGMSSKFTECTLGQMYRVTDAKGHLSGGPMRYLHLGLAELGLGGFGRVLAIVFAVMCIGGSFGGGNMFQANQSYVAVAEQIPFLADKAWLYGAFLAVITGVVIIGGIKSIGAAASVIVPVMCGIYVLAALFVLAVNLGQIPAAFGSIISGAFTPEAGYGGLLGVLITGFRRAAFSNEAGIGSASIAHSAAATEEPVREGIVALLEPFIDTIVICTMTGLVVVVTGVYKTHPGEGVLMTSEAFRTVIPWFPAVLALTVFLFAYSTMISWSYYGERCWAYLFGEGYSLFYRGIFLMFVFFGAVFKLGNVLDFSDLMVLGMAFPNIIGLFLLSGKVRAALDDYWGRYTSGQMKRER
ncbi:MAG: alanine:cation symporter family protein [Deltaproteobacteria bacterium]|nr:alanine:cation symporter family protein [Deltaproteobacteria bacterium]